MEAVFFRFLARELAALLPGCRVEKVFLPAQNVFSMALYLPPGREAPDGSGKKTVYLHARYGTGRFFLFLSPQKTVQPERAPAAAMRLRKHLRGRRVAGVVADWQNRRLALVMAGEGPHLLLDPKSFPQLCDAPPPPQEGEPDWPQPDAILSDPDIWRPHPQLSPALRRRLAALPQEQAAAVYARLRAPEAEGYFLEYAKGEPDALWPVRWAEKDKPGRETRAFPSALAAAAAFGEPLAFGEVSGRQDAPQAAAATAAARRLSRALVKLAADEARMREFLARRPQADLLAANLHALDKQAKIPHLFLPGPDGVPVALELDPSLTVVRNMQKLYDLAAKGERGLAAIARRRQDLQGGKKDLQSRQRGAPTAQPPRPAPGPFEGVAANAYRTSDGFLVLRGKNAKAGESLLRKANPFDLWFHVAGGPGAHVILRRDHPRREVPRESLLQAAGLAALASFASGAGAAEVMLAKAGDVRRIKGAATGKVAVGALLETLRVDVDPALENLRQPG
ncbi:NFACT RNA binding domain-containing protein [Solidesulfovibrio alcoholivorans]|uniref:NFACT RNA binding domain-containing protein n=1 Tax=Solidesulfovibrio alcoholivorans TaxID=81406 RepID=UPI0004972FDB|nr:NFACT RNA binding domain-containing protein [Solidesulfovibrio alcoholivorans]